MDAPTRYGRWTIIDPTVSYRAHDRVSVRCDCGTERQVKYQKLTQGESKSCGCLRRDRMAGKVWPNLAPDRSRRVEPGARFGRWTALTLPYSQPGARNRFADCRCDCGTERPVVAGHLLSGHTKSCGCLLRDANRVRHQTIN
jgi:hypothetical protein